MVQLERWFTLKNCSLDDLTNLAEDAGCDASHKILDVCVMVGTAVLAVVLSPLVPLYFLYEAVFERGAPDYSHMNGHAHAIH